MNLQFGDVLIAAFVLTGALSMGLFALAILGACRWGVDGLMARVSNALPGNKRTAAWQAAEEFKGQVTAFRSRLSVLEEYSPDYFSAFQASHWGEINKTMAILNSAEGQLDALLSQRDYRWAHLLATFLLDRSSPEDRNAVIADFPQYEPLGGWLANTKEQLSILIENLNDSAEKNAEVGLHRTRERKATMLMLREIRKTLE